MSLNNFEIIISPIMVSIQLPVVVSNICVEVRVKMPGSINNSEISKLCSTIIYSENNKLFTYQTRALHHVLTFGSL